MTVADEVLESFHRVLVDEIRAKRPDYLSGPFTVAEIYQDLVPYVSHRDRIGVEMNGDYEDALIRMLAGEGEYLVLESEHALRELRSELASRNPNTGVYREYAAVDVRLNPARIEPGASVSTGAPTPKRRAGGGSGPPSTPTSTGTGNGTPARPEAGVAAPTTAADQASGPEASGEACRWCRASLPPREGLKFCPFCGTDVHSLPCSACGEGLQPGWRFCIACGAEHQG